MKLTCSICKVKHGACVRCSHGMYLHLISLILLKRDREYLTYTILLFMCYLIYENTLSCNFGNVEVCRCISLLLQLWLRLWVFLVLINSLSWFQIRPANHMISDNLILLIFSIKNHAIQTGMPHINGQFFKN